MQTHPAALPRPRPAFALALGSTLLAGCIHSDGGPKHLVLSESEPNDGVCCADDFGLLAPGDFLAIHGFITDDGFDPFDGYAFTAWEPISVEFRVFADSGADLDVCLYDPQLGVIVDCFESPFNPETGVAHVLTGGADFHLVVNSFAGSSSYTLELDVFPLDFASAAPAAKAGALAGGAHGLGGKPDRRAAFAAYGGAPMTVGTVASTPAEASALLGTGLLYTLDLKSGELGTAFFARTSEGTLVWMGKPEEEGTEGP